jgi:hypothetical protein
VRRLSKQESRQRWSEIQELLCEWDPIGVMDHNDGPRDEYDDLVGPCLRLLEAEATEVEIAKFLYKAIDERYGMDPTSYDFPAVAAKLKHWYIKNWPGTHV